MSSLIGFVGPSAVSMSLIYPFPRRSPDRALGERSAAIYPSPTGTPPALYPPRAVRESARVGAGLLQYLLTAQASLLGQMGLRRVVLVLSAELLEALSVCRHLHL